jgi:hypothetical protein
MHYVLFEFCITMQMVWIILSPSDYLNPPWLSKNLLFIFAKCKTIKLHLIQILLSVDYSNNVA